MRNQAIGEELSADHFHMTWHFTVPFPGADQAPVWVATTARHVNNHLVATGPLLATPFLDCPYPMPDLGFDVYLQAVIDSLAAVKPHTSGSAVHGTGGRRLTARLMPRGVPETDPLW
jgi:hypothetical protein